VADAFLVIERMFAGVWFVLTHVSQAIQEHRTGVPPFWFKELLYGLALAALLGLLEFVQKERPITEALATQPLWARWGAYYGMLLLIFSVGVSGAQSFIYFQF